MCNFVHMPEGRVVNRDRQGWSSDGPPLRILCIDDNRDVADSEVELLRIVGIEARACYSGQDALTQAVSFLPSMCLIDLNMPNMDGDELAIRLRELLSPPLILVAVTAMTNEACSRRVRQAGFDLHLIKPVSPHELLTVVNELWRAWYTNVRRRNDGVLKTSEQT